MTDGKAIVDELLNADVYDDETELYHHGILGQKWGVRRYQNADGSLTKAGEKRYGTAENFNRVQEAKNAAKLRKKTAKADAEIAKYRDKNAEKEQEKASLNRGKNEKKVSKDDRPISEMTNEEIQAKIDRLTLENKLRQITPAKEKSGKEKFAEAAGEIAKKGINDLITKGNTALVDAGKKWLEKTLGLDEKKLSALEKESRDAKLKMDVYKMQQEEAKARNEAAKADKIRVEADKQKDAYDKDKAKERATEDAKARAAEAHDKKLKDAQDQVDSYNERMNGNYRVNKSDLAKYNDAGQKRISSLLLLEDKSMKHSAEEFQNELYHHGILGQKWGVRRYQNPDGTLTDKGKKHQEKLTASNREASIAKGTALYRISTNGKSDASSDKIYVSATKDSGDYYLQALGSSKIYKTGKAYVQEYVATKDLKMPSKKVMEKIELGLLKDKAVQKELIDSLMAKGLSREEATAQVKPYSVGKDIAEKAGAMTVGALMFGAQGAIYGAAAGGLPGMAVGAGVGAAAGLGLGAASGSEKSRALDVARVSYGDKNNKVINETLQKKLAEKGYNAMKDYNDRRAFGDKGNQAVIVFNSKDNIKSTKISEVKSKDYGESYARNYLKEHPSSKLDFSDLVKDGEKKYKKLYEDGLVNREQEKARQKILAKAAKKK